MKKIYIAYSDFTDTLYAFSKKDYSDKQDVSEQFANIVRRVCKLNDSKEIKIGDLVLQIKEIKEKWLKKKLKTKYQSIKNVVRS